MSLELLTPDGDPFDDAEAPLLEAGTESDLAEANLWWSRGDDTSTPAADVVLILEVEDADEPGSWLSSGVPMLDERWARARVVGEVTTSHPEMAPQRTDWTPLGAGAALRLDPIFGDCARSIEIQWIVPGSAAPGPFRLRLSPLGGSRAAALPVGVTEISRGVLSGVGDLSRFGLLRGGEVTASATPDDEVHVAAAQWLSAGRVIGLAPVDLTFDDLDGDADPLAAGEAYTALLSLGGSGLVVTKGVKAIAPTRPVLPAGEVFLRYAVIRYTGGAPEVAGTDLEGETLYDRHFAVAGPGRAITLHPGRVLAGGTLRTRGDRETIALPAAATRFVWQLSAGAYGLTATEVAPETTAVLLWQVTTDATDVTALVDRRLYAGGEVVLRLAGDAPGSPGVVASTLVGDSRLYIERVLWRVDTHGAATSGATTLDILADGDSIFPSAGAVVPSIAWGADPLIDAAAVPEMCELRVGQVVSIATTEYPTGGAPGWVEVNLICRRG